jgi:hypothetical protein
LWIASSTFIRSGLSSPKKCWFDSSHRQLFWGVEGPFLPAVASRRSTPLVSVWLALQHSRPSGSFVRGDPDDARDLCALSMPCAALGCVRGLDTTLLTMQAQHPGRRSVCLSGHIHVVPLDDHYGARLPWMARASEPGQAAHRPREPVHRSGSALSTTSSTRPRSTARSETCQAAGDNQVAVAQVNCVALTPVARVTRRRHRRLARRRSFGGSIGFADAGPERRA